MGAAEARNTGLTSANGKMIAFLDADDTWEDSCLEKLHTTLSSNPDAAIAYCGWQNIGVSAKRSKPYVPPDYEKPNKIEFLLTACRWPIHAALTRLKYIKEAGGFNSSLGSCEDYDLWLRIGSFNKIVLLPEVLAFYHHHQGNQTTKNRLRIALDHALAQKYFFNNNPKIKSEFGRKKIRDIIEGELLHRAYISYWERDLETAHALFRTVFRKLYFKLSDLKYILPSLLPFPLFKRLVHLFEK
jgi:glycosyltransferase involved in cell wall biosynthesis